jgi:hypothetical protein
MIKYQIINASDNIRMAPLIQMGMPVYLVTKLSRKAAAIKTGTSPKTIFIPSFPAFKMATPLEYVFGKRILLPNTRPAAPAITIAETSRVPWRKTTRMDCMPNPLEKK